MFFAKYLLSLIGFRVIGEDELHGRDEQLIALRAECDALRSEREVILRDRVALEHERDALRSEREVILRDRVALEHERDALRIERETILGERESYRIGRDNAQQELSRQSKHVDIAKSTFSNKDTILSYLDASKSQFGQDLFVLGILGLKREGFFVEFGATNGIDISNTYLLEKEFQWTGILAEPARCWRDSLSANRSAQIDFSCVWRSSGGTLTFNETANPELSTVNSFSGSDFLAEDRKAGLTYDVPTISLGDLLSKHGAPEKIDYLSIDTEGSEFEILSKFDFSKYRISVITCEHNFTSNRDRIFELLTSKGFLRVHEDISGVDDWYVNRGNF